MKWYDSLTIEQAAMTLVAVQSSNIQLPMNVTPRSRSPEAPVTRMCQIMASDVTMLAASEFVHTILFVCGKGTEYNNRWV